MGNAQETLRRLQQIIDESAASAGPAIARNFIGGGWAMTAEEFVAFWATGPMASISTVSAKGDVHVAPLEPRLIDGAFYAPTHSGSETTARTLAAPSLPGMAPTAPSLCTAPRGNARVMQEFERARPQANRATHLLAW